MTFGQAIQVYRLKAGLSQSQLAQKAGIAVKTIQNWEINRRTPRWIRLLARLAKGLDVPMEALVPDESQELETKLGAKKPPKRKEP
jgi:transcriptional regulator with XRE-family HTH domain